MLDKIIYNIGKLITILLGIFLLISCLLMIFVLGMVIKHGIAHAEVSQTATATKQVTIKVAVLDTGIDPALTQVPLCLGLSKDFTGSKTLADNWPTKHGSNVADLIRRHAGAASYCLIVVKVFNTPKEDVTGYINGLKYALSLKPDYIHLSVNGPSKMQDEIKLLKEALDAGTKVIVAAGNQGADFNKTGCNSWPACADSRLIVVGSSTGRYGNLGREVDVFEDGTAQKAGGVTLTGTSQAAAIHTGTLLREAASK